MATFMLPTMTNLPAGWQSCPRMQSTWKLRWNINMGWNLNFIILSWFTLSYLKVESQYGTEYHVDRISESLIAQWQVIIIVVIIITLTFNQYIHYRPLYSSELGHSSGPEPYPNFLKSIQHNLHPWILRTGSKMMSWYESTKHTFLKMVKWC